MCDIHHQLPFQPPTRLDAKGQGAYWVGENFPYNCIRTRFTFLRKLARYTALETLHCFSYGTFKGFISSFFLCFDSRRIGQAYSIGETHHFNYCAFCFVFFLSHTHARVGRPYIARIIVTLRISSKWLEHNQQKCANKTPPAQDEKSNLPPRVLFIFKLGQKPELPSCALADAASSTKSAASRAPFAKLVEGKYSSYPPLSFPPRIGLYPEEINAESNSFSSLSLQLTLGFSGSNPLEPPPLPAILRPRCAAAVAVAAAVRRRRRVRTEERNPVRPFAAAEDHRSAIAAVKPNRAAIEARRRSSSVVVRRSACRFRRCEGSGGDYDPGMVRCGELCCAGDIVIASIRVLSSIATHGRHDVEAVSCGYSGAPLARVKLFE
uniref:Genomic DNA, chromosome 3, clone:P0043E01 n=1 Tax=Oryza sativa subsp. japonica TaxID=39947 RepID=Q9SNJ2_ORYSJ|nr:unnamed protein product [Oryza sativa Japonica Group]